MKVDKQYPRDALKPYIKKFVIIETEYELNSLVLPDTSLTMAFTLSGKVKDLESAALQNDLPPFVISGVNRSASQFRYSKQTSNILVFFNETGTSAFVKEPLNLLSNQKVALDNFFRSSQLIELRERLLEAKTNQKRFFIIERFLLENLTQSKPDDIVENAIRQIQLSKGSVKINKLIEPYPLSRDPFDKRFRRVTGTSPKQFATIVRLRNLVAQYPSTHNLTDLAYTAGYFDQAHFIKDFKTYTGLTPSEYFSRFGNHNQ